MDKPTFSSWFVYWDTLHGRQALYSFGPHLDEVDLFAYHFAADDTLVPADPNLKELQDAFLQLPGPAKPRLAITLVNDLEDPGGIHLKDPGCVHCRVVATPAVREVHIQQILAIAEGAESIDIDYERVAPEDGAAFTAFVQALANKLHQKGKRLSVVVEPRVSDQRTSDPLSNSSDALSWKDIGLAADRLTVMAYLYHYGGSEPGSIAPIDWVGEIAAYGLQNVPADKLCIALHLGGFDWPKVGPGKSLEFDKAQALATAYGASIALDHETQSGHFSYTDGSGRHDVWIETAAGLRAKVEKLRRAGVSHFAFWRLGAGDSALWANLNNN